MDSVIEAVLFVLDLVIPDKNPRFRRVQRIGCVLFGGFRLVGLGIAVFEIFIDGTDQCIKKRQFYSVR
jgi:hypothetical protein